MRTWKYFYLMIYFRFLKQENFEERLKTFTGKFEEMYVPANKSPEKYCYVSVWDADFEKFVRHFASEEDLNEPNIMEEEDDEWPTSLKSFATGRMRTFTLYTL